jgi:hypothetical protein
MHLSELLTTNTAILLDCTLLPPSLNIYRLRFSKKQL